MPKRNAPLRYSKYLRQEVYLVKITGIGYIRCKAHEKAIKRTVKQRYKAPLKNLEIFLYARQHLRDYGWTPQ